MSDECRKAALALVLCTPSSVNTALVKGDMGEVDKLVTELGLKDEWDALRKKLEPQGGIDVQVFNQVSRQSADWDGNPPHPPDPQLKAIVAAILALDAHALTQSS